MSSGTPPFGTGGGPPPQYPGTEGVGSISTPPGPRTSATPFVGPRPNLRPFIFGSDENDKLALRPGAPGGLLRGPGGDTQVAAWYLGRLPPGQIQWYHRKTSANPSGLSIINRTLLATLGQLPYGMSLVIESWVLFWLDTGCFPLDPVRLEERGVYADSDGRIWQNLLFNGQAVYDSQESLYDVGAATTREVAGFTTLNVNLLDMGGHPNAIFVPDGAKIEAKWQWEAAPGVMPGAVGMEIHGWVMPTKLFNEMLIHLRAAV